MISLQTMRDRNKLKWPVYGLFAIVIISFVFLYGWDIRSFNTQQVAPYAQLRNQGLNPLKRTIKIDRLRMKAGSDLLVPRKLGMLPPQFVQLLSRNDRADLVTQEEAAREAANMVVLDRIANEMGVWVAREDFINFLKEQPGLTNQGLQYLAQQQEYASVEDYIQAQRKGMQDDRVRTLVSRLAHASLYELWQEYSLNNERIEMLLAAYPVAGFEDQVVVTEDDLAEHLAENSGDFRKPAQRRYAYVKLTKQEMRETLAPTEEEIRLYYEQNQAEYRREAGLKAEELAVALIGDRPTTEVAAILEGAREEARGAADWDELSRKLEQRRPGLACYASESQWLAEDALGRPAQYVKTLYALRDDEVSTPILLTSTASILRVAGRREAGVAPLEEVRTEVRFDFQDAKVEELFDEAARQWRAVLDERRDADGRMEIQDFSEAVSVRDELTTEVARAAQTIPEIGVLERSLAEYVTGIEQGELSDVFEVEEALVVLQIRTEREAYDPPLGEVREDVEAVVRGERALELARRTTEQNLEVIRGGAEFETALADAPISSFKTAPFRRTESDQTEVIGGLGDHRLIDFRRSTLGIGVGSQGMSPYGDDPERPQGFAIWQITSLTEPPREDFAAARYQFEQQYVQLQQLALIEEWLADERNKAQYQVLADQ